MEALLRKGLAQLGLDESGAPSLLRYIVEKGSITIDGISLTVATVDANGFSISAIPHTVAVTILSE